MCKHESSKNVANFIFYLDLVTIEGSLGKDQRYFNGETKPTLLCNMWKRVWLKQDLLFASTEECTKKWNEMLCGFMAFYDY